MVVKVLDACVEPFQHYWVFAAGLTSGSYDDGYLDVPLGFTFVWFTVLETRRCRSRSRTASATAAA